ncbi:hypothetical protein B0J13DRAFT_102206 [Dactylonectria estremocensis]|uniref:Uncharacterized protein n=1 Tax=Dactylonectria estremocensis TaxID=1079267 RepID=A0A9P9EBF8_9HYPO|nr:hypothetical protein B0J13DRAFT_102206 [Dactylonectria estremocensis]
MSSPYSVQIHQHTKEPSIGSTYSRSSASSASSGNSTPRSLSPGEYREYGASDQHVSRVSSSGRNVIINHGKVTYDPNSPHVPYGGGYSRP